MKKRLAMILVAILMFFGVLMAQNVELYAEGETVTVGSELPRPPEEYEDYALDGDPFDDFIDIYLVSYDDTSAALVVCVPAASEASTPQVNLKSASGTILDFETFINDDWLSVAVSGLTAETEYKVSVSLMDSGNNYYEAEITFTTTTSAPSPTWTVSFDSNGGSAVSSQNVLNGDYASEPSDPTRDHYTFDGWYEDKDVWSILWDTEMFNTQVINYDVGDLELHAKWIADTHAVTFESNGGTSVGSQNIDYGELVDEPPEPSKPGHTFAGWFTDDTTYLDPWNFESDEVEGDLILYAKWIVKTYVVTFDSNGGTTVDNYFEIYHNTTIPKPDDPTRVNYSFIGWFRNENLTGEWSFAHDTITSNTTLYAKWSKDIDHTIDDWFDSIGLENSWGRLFVSLVSMLGLIIFLSILGVPSVLIFLMIVIFLVLMASLSIIPGWNLIVLSIVLIGLLYLAINSQIGGGSDD